MSFLQRLGKVFLLLRVSSFLKDFFTTSGTSVISTVALLLMMRLLTGYFSPAGFGAYSLVRRILASFIPIACLGANAALPFFVARVANDLDRKRYLAGATISIILFLSLFLLLGVSFKKQLAILLFQSYAYESLVIALLFIIAGYAFQTTIYSFYRGTLDIQLANLWEILLVAVGPLLVVVVTGHLQRVDVVVLGIGILTWVALIPLISGLVEVLWHTKWSDLVQPTRDLLNYGIPRIPGSFYSAALLGYGPFLVSKLGTFEEAGYLSASLSILSIIQTPILAFGTVILPRISRMSQNGDQESIATITEAITEMVFQLGTFVTCCSMIWTPEIVMLLLGPEYGNAIPLMRIVLLAIVPYLTYVLLRSVIDAVDTRSINTNHLFISLGVAVLCSLLGIRFIGVGSGVTVGIVFGMYTLGGLTLYYLFRKYRIQIAYLPVLQILVINGVLMIAQIIMRESITMVWSKTLQYAFLMLSVMIFGLLYGWILLKIKGQWIVNFFQYIHVRNH
jgi:O-antigen/teichoic acid export membrane protein